VRARSCPPAGHAQFAFALSRAWPVPKHPRAARREEGDYSVEQIQKMMRNAAKSPVAASPKGKVRPSPSGQPLTQDRPHG
jgi:hypothetical protein